VESNESKHVNNFDANVAQKQQQQNQRGIFQLVKQPLTHLTSDNNNANNNFTFWPQKNTDTSDNNRKSRISTHSYSSPSHRPPPSVQHIYDEINYDCFCRQDDLKTISVSSSKDEYPNVRDAHNDKEEEREVTTRARSINEIIKSKPPLNNQNLSKKQQPNAFYHSTTYKSNNNLSKSEPNFSDLFSKNEPRFWVEEVMLDSSSYLPKYKTPLTVASTTNTKSMQNLMKTHLTNDSVSSPRYTKANHNIPTNNSYTQSYVNFKSFRGQHQLSSENLGLRSVEQEQNHLINVVKYKNKYEENFAKEFDEYYANDNTINGLKTAHYSNHMNNNVEVCH
jgi:hypothetical protein